MSSWQFDHVLIPVASVRDADATMTAAIPRLRPTGRTATVVHVIEKAGGAPDKASVEQRVREAETIFDSVRAAARDAGVAVQTELRFGTDVTKTILETAAEVDADAIVFTPRGGSRWVHLLTGDVALSLIEETDRPVIVLPDVGNETEEDDG